MSREWQIVLLCSRVTLKSGEQQCLNELINIGVDWHKVFQLAGYHGVQALVFRNLVQCASRYIPEELLDSARHHLRKQVIISLKMSAALQQLLVTFQEQGIPVVPFKGPVFTERFMGDAALRSYCDLDLLIYQDDLSAVAGLLRENGFMPHFPLTGSQLQLLAETDNEYPFIHCQKGLVVDLQWELTGGYSTHRLYFGCLAQNLQTYNFFGQDVSIFSLEDQIVYLCIHGNQHTWDRLDQVSCLAETLRCGEIIHWEKVWQRAKDLRVTRMVRIGLLLALRLLEAPVPQDIQRLIINDAKAVHLANDRMTVLKQAVGVGGGGLSRRFVLYHWQSLDSLWLMICYGLRIAFVPTRYDWQLFPLPTWLVPLHYLIRPLRLLWSGLKVLFRSRVDHSMGET